MQGALSYWRRLGVLAGEAPGDGAQPRLPYSTGAPSFPRKREPTHSPDYGYGIPAYAGNDGKGLAALRLAAAPALAVA